MMFSRTTIVKVIEALKFQTHSEVEKFALEFGLENIITGSYIKEKENSLMRYLIQNPQAVTPNGTHLSYSIIEYLIAKRCKDSKPEEEFPELVYSLDKDGYIIYKNGIKNKLPSQLPIADEEDELIELLNKFGFSVAKGHYEQALTAHTRGDWAAANSQLRSFVEEFFDRATDKIVPGSYASSHNRRETLATVNYFRSDLNEWSNDGKGFIQGFWKRLHPQGAHPGLSEKEDSTLRLHLVIVVMHYFAKRLESF
jgi:hypothetical protein